MTLNLLGAHSSVGQLFGRGMLLNVLNAAQDLFRNWRRSGQQVGLGMEAVFIGNIGQLNWDTLRGYITEGSLRYDASRTLLRKVYSIALRYVVGVTAIRFDMG